jgi:hypothetical protein
VCERIARPQLVARCEKKQRRAGAVRDTKDGRFRLHQRGRPRRVARLELAALKADIDTGLADSAAGRVKDFDATRIVGRGRKLLADRSPSV